MSFIGDYISLGGHVGRYSRKFWDNNPGLIGILATGGVANILQDVLKIPIAWTCEITDTRSGATAQGKGATKDAAAAEAWFNLTGKKDDVYTEREEERRKKQIVFENRKKESERKQNEWEARQKEKVTRKAEQEKKQREWEARQKERDREKERKQKEWEARKAEQERKKCEWEARKAESDRKRKEWELRQKERESKQREYEARQAERAREKERKQKEYEERQRERERKNQAWAERKQNSKGKGKSSGGCYISTAVCLTLGKDDDCLELSMIRSYRDDWLIYQRNGMAIINAYYSDAPFIVEAINRRPDKRQIYFSILEKYLLCFFNLIREKRNKEATRIYLTMVRELGRNFLRGREKNSLM